MDWVRFALGMIAVISIALLYRETCIVSARCRMLIRKAEKATKERNWLAIEGMDAALGANHVGRENIFMRYRRSFLKGHKSEWSLEQLLRAAEAATEEK